MDDFNGIAGSHYYDNMLGYGGSNNNMTNMTNMTNGTAGINASSPIVPPDSNHRDPAAGEPVKVVDIPGPVHSPETHVSTYPIGNATGEPAHNATGNASGEPVHNTTGNATHNMTAKASTSHKMLSTGNPILALFAISAVLGGAAVIRKK